MLSHAAFTILLLTYGSALFFGFFTPYLNLSWIYDNFLPLLTSSVAFSSGLALYLYATSFKRGALLGAHGATPYPLYNFWMGRELNPRLGGVDLKEFCELYPGLIGWLVINLGMAHKQVQQLGYVTNSMLLVNAFQLYYVVDSVWNEAAILTTMDVTTEGFGYMLAFGDLAWVPFVFTTATRFLVDYPQVGEASAFWGGGYLIPGGLPTDGESYRGGKQTGERETGAWEVVVWWGSRWGWGRGVDGGEGRKAMGERGGHICPSRTAHMHSHTPSHTSHPHMHTSPSTYPHPAPFLTSPPLTCCPPLTCPSLTCLPPTCLPPPTCPSPACLPPRSFPGWAWQACWLSS